MNGAAPAGLTGPVSDIGEFGHVLGGVVLHGPAARLARMLDPGFLGEAGWDPATRLLSLPAEHLLLGRVVCRIDGCARSVYDGLPGVCHRCFTRLAGQGLSRARITEAATLPPAPPHAVRCAVRDCEYPPTVRESVLCEPHARMLRGRVSSPTLKQFLSDRRVHGLAEPAECLVAACIRPADGAAGYCNTHYQRWRVAQRAEPSLDRRRWQAIESPVAEPGQVNLRALPARMVVEVLFGVQQRVGDGAKITDTGLRVLCDALRHGQADTITAGRAVLVLSKSLRSLFNALETHVRRALADPESEQAKDVWDLAVFGHAGNLSFTGISQPWLARAAKRWAAEQLPRHRGRGGARVRDKINALGLLSQYWSCRPDHGLEATGLRRGDVEGFLNRLAHLESTGRISRYRRNTVCRNVREVLNGIRGLGLTRPGGPAAGLAGDVAIGRGDIPAEAQRGEPGRDLPPEIMAILCAGLDSLEPTEVRVAAQLGIDTGRRPEDILALPLDCLSRDRDGKPVLVYDNAKADRLARRLPIGRATADVIAAQQGRVRERFPETAQGELKLLPSPRRNPHGHRAISTDTLNRRIRQWVDAMPVLRTEDGTEFDKTKVFPYAWRHSYAQRHADAGIGIDVLAELLDHRNLNITRGYYRVGEDRRRAAVDTVTALSFDRHGNRIWRDAATLLASEHARYAVGEVAVPYGRCTEPSNVAAGGGACPIRFRCVGCDHFRTDISYLPELTAYLDDLLRTREYLAAAVDGVDDWARADAIPSSEEIARVRNLIGRIKAGADQMSATDRATVNDAVNTIRRHRTVSLGMPTTRTAPATATEATK